MTCRIENGQTFLQSYNAENRMDGVSLINGDCNTLTPIVKSWLFTYDGNGTRVRQVYTEGATTTTNYAKHPVSEASKGYFAGGSYEIQTDGSTETVRQYYAIAGVTVGMREASTFYYFLTDHLGSVVGVTDGDGALISETRFLPFGEIRTDIGTVTQTDYGFTFQRNVKQMGLMDYKARYYSTYLNRFVQPDSIVPGVGNPQAWNRYSYTTNNPVKYIDPSGHKACSDWDDEGGCIVASILNPGIKVGDLSTSTQYEGSRGGNYPINSGGDLTCSRPLADCFGDVVNLKDFSENDMDNPIPIGEFNDFLDKVATDLNTHDLGWPGFNAGRATYDTPFYNNGESSQRTGIPDSEKGIYPSNQTVCIETIRCSGRSEINYVAQGMWGAAVGEPKFVSVAITKSWKKWEYGGPASVDTLFWLQYGYDFYKNWNK